MTLYLDIVIKNYLCRLIRASQFKAKHTDCLKPLALNPLIILLGLET